MCKRIGVVSWFERWIMDDEQDMPCRDQASAIYMWHWIATLDSVIAWSMVSLPAELSGSYLRRLVTNAQAASVRHAFKCMLHALGRYRQLCCVIEWEMAQPTLRRSRTCRLGLAEESVAEQSRTKHLDDCTLYSGGHSNLPFTSDSKQHQ